MFNPSHVPSELIDLRDYNPCFELGPSGIDYQLQGRKDGRGFSVDYSLGFERPAGYTANETEFEPHTLYIHNVQSGQDGLGSAALALLLAHAKEQDFSTARMGVLDPRMIGVVEKLLKLNLIKARYYLPEIGEHIQPLPATAAFATSPDLLTPDDAWRRLVEAEPLIEAREAVGQSAGDDLFVAQCVITF